MIGCCTETILRPVDGLVLIDPPSFFHISPRALESPQCYSMIQLRYLSAQFPIDVQYFGDIPDFMLLKDDPSNYDTVDVACFGMSNHAGSCSNDLTGKGLSSSRDTVNSYYRTD